ncbi:hypothetical protein [Vibrio superstes]|uniref:Uncharacterized protein n=1 Tax=Vibrio superstes NBRC 103154 TaxID=1219062 RepID=A0A511QNK2_9VIBR|nr:hypothetical protein [Vibrio superstes]GEM78898.1 hypothetical protein VSU01S_11430 [Vibrio superstes NBRC 103154]
MKNNFFNHAPKELALDGFLNWLIIEIKATDDIVSFFTKLGLCPNGTSSISEVKVRRQEKSTDLIIRYSADSKPYKALFENKTRGSASREQLKKYKKEFSDFQYYKFLKLARINFAEQKLLDELEYVAIGAQELCSAIECLTFSNQVTREFTEFLKFKYIEKIQYIESSMVSDNNYSLFADSQAQHHLIDAIHREIDGTNDATWFKSGANVGGRPWTQLDIGKKPKAYADSTEHLFWRVDEQIPGYYLRLTQYANVEAEFKETKQKNRDKLREIFAPISKRYDLTYTKPNNKGIKECEILKLFFKDNELPVIYDSLVELSKELIEAYYEISYDA